MQRKRGGEKMRHIIFFKSQKGTCPHCGGLLYQVYSDEIVLNCMDCNTYYKAIGPGHAESELEFEEIRKNET